MIDSRVSFKGKVHFVNNESYKNFIGCRNHINKLKHHCGNNKLTHIIQHDKNFFVITTTYEHEKKIDGTTFNILSFVSGSQKSSDIDNIVNTHIDKVRLLKKGVDKRPNYQVSNKKVSEKESVFEKILKFFQKR